MGIILEDERELKDLAGNGPLEPIKLVIWDLDETFWKGTLSEGGITRVASHCELVKLLAQRGIISSICSRNEFEAVALVLREWEMWSYFVMPSISWQPKAPRLRSLIETLNFRTVSVLFIDDNHFNREEAKNLIPGLMVSDPTIIADMAALPQLAGKSDPCMSRLGQYKLLEQREVDKQEASGETTAFLRKSHITVSIEHNIEEHLERACELINRTNQLNFVKSRLPEDSEKAAAELRCLLARHDIQAGLVRVTDRYGDHGFCGVYILEGNWRLLQYAFSCRIMGMGIERWLYQRLGRPKIQAAYNTLVHVFDEEPSIDWIHNSDCSEGAQLPASSERRWIAARGGCDLQAVCHYLNLTDPESVGEFNFNRNGCDVRIDHSMFLRYAICGLPSGGLEASKLVGYRDEDFRSSLLKPRSGLGVWLLSFWSDAVFALYRHRETGVTIPWNLYGWHDQAKDIADASLENLSLDPGIRDALAAPLLYLKKNFEYLGLISEELFKQNLKVILSAAPRGTHVVILAANEKLLDPQSNVQLHAMQYQSINAWTRAVARWRRNVSVLDVRQFIDSDAEVHNWSHFDRMVYFRIFLKVREMIGTKTYSNKNA